MDKILFQILDECNKAGIRKEQACFYQFDKGVFTYTVDLPDNVIHCFEFTGTDFQIFDKIKVEHLIHMDCFITFKHKVWLDGKVIGESAMSFNPNKIHIQ